MKLRKKRNMSEIVPIYSPRSTYKKIKTTDEKMIADMTLNFDKLTINLLKQEFNKRNNELNLEQFIVIAKKHLKFWQNDIPNRQVSLMRYLTFLFNQIDINGNGDMEWDEFTNYIIQKATVLKNLKSKADEIKHYVKSKVKPKIKIDGTIQKSQYIQDLDKIAFYEQGANKIEFMSLETGEISQKNINIDPKKLVVNISSVKKQKNGKVSIRKKDLVLPTQVRVLDMIYLSEKKYKILLVSTSDGYVRGWKNNQNGFYLANQPDNEQQPFQHYFPSQIYCMAWDQINQILYCGQKNGSIYMWNLKTDLQKPLCEMKGTSCEKQCNEEKVNYMITSMITMPKLQFMASGRMDGKLILWDTINNKKKWTYSQHTRGILTLSFNQAMILLFSAGFDHKICIWNPYISTLIHRIQGHLAPILSLKVIEGTHQLISVDSEGIVKITDTRRFNFIYSFSVQSSQDGSNSSSLSSLMVINKPLKLVFTGKSIYIYEYDKNYHPNTADQNTAICCKYVKQKLCLFTPMGNKIKVWSALNGDIERIYMDITTHQISTFQFDFLKKRMIVGDTKGNITLHNTANGAKMKTLSKHNGQITHLIATQNDSNVDIFISCGLDNQIRIFKETQESYEIIRTIYIIKEAAITCLDYCPSTKLIIVGSNVGTLAFYDIETGKTAGTCLNKSYQQFTSICKTNNSMIISSSSSGKISIIAMPPLPNRFQKIFAFYHEDSQKTGTPLGVRSVCYSNQLKQLYTIDDKMYLTCYSFEQIQQRNQMCLKVQQKVQSVRRALYAKIFEQAKIKVIWQCKAHQQVIKSLQYIEQQKLLVTTSFDKKVKLWDAKSGQYLDSLQQNYNKSQAVPIAYYNTKTSTLYSSDLKISKPVENIDPVKVQFDPFTFQLLLQSYPQLTKIKNSNQDWKINVDFRDIAVQQMKKFQQLAAQIMQIQDNTSQTKAVKRIKISQIKAKFNEQKKMLKILLGQGRDTNEGKQNNDQPTFPSPSPKLTPSSNRIKDKQRQKEGMKQSQKGTNSQTSIKDKQQKIQIPSKIQKQFCQLYKEQCLNALTQNSQKQNKKRVSNAYFKRSILKCIQNYITKKQNETLIDKNNKRKSQRDFIPIYQILKNRQKAKDEVQEHRKYIEDLSKRYTESFLNGQIDQRAYFLNNQSQAAQKFYKMLNSINQDETKQKDKKVKQITMQNFSDFGSSIIPSKYQGGGKQRNAKSRFQQNNVSTRGLPKLY